MTHPPKQFLAMGELLVDIIGTIPAEDLADVDSFTMKPGGAPANGAVALCRMGLPGAFCGVVGDDAFGRKLQKALAAEGVDTSRVRFDPIETTTMAFAWKDHRGDGHFWLIRHADLQLSNADVDAAGIPQVAALLVGSVALPKDPSQGAIWHAAEIAHATGVPLCFDVNIRPLLWEGRDAALAACLPVFRHATLVKASLDDARYLFGDALEAPDAFAPLRRVAPGASIVITDGGRGAWVEEGGVVHHVPAYPVNAIEPTGAGDAFNAALLKRLSEQGWPAPTVADVQYAAAAGALATTMPGAWEGLPTPKQLDAFLEQHGNA